MEETSILIHCGRCKNKSNLKVRATYVQERVSLNDEYYVTTWRILECLACHHLNLGETYIESGWPSDEIEEQIIFPTPFPIPTEKHLQSLPEQIDRVYSSALRVKNAPNAFAVQIGRTLEMVCKHENAKGKVLADKLKYLAHTGLIPPTLALMADQLRVLRNLGAHADDDDDEVRKGDVLVIKEFVDAILEYLYVAPAKVKKLQDRLDGKQQEKLTPFDEDFSF